MILLLLLWQMSQKVWFSKNPLDGAITKLKISPKNYRDIFLKSLCFEKLPQDGAEINLHNFKLHPSLLRHLSNFLWPLDGVQNQPSNEFSYFFSEIANVYQNCGDKQMSLKKLDFCLLLYLFTFWKIQTKTHL